MGGITAFEPEIAELSWERNGLRWEMVLSEYNGMYGVSLRSRRLFWSWSGFSSLTCTTSIRSKNRIWCSESTNEKKSSRTT